MRGVVDAVPRGGVTFSDQDQRGQNSEPRSLRSELSVATTKKLLPNTEGVSRNKPTFLTTCSAYLLLCNDVEAVLRGFPSSCDRECNRVSRSSLITLLCVHPIVSNQTSISTLSD